jgi:outer membrane receptor protein involved in Fe transport
MPRLVTIPRVIGSMRMTAIVVLASAGFNTAALAQGAEVRGRVLQPDGTAPIPGAEVMIRGGAVRTTADSAGRFALRAVPAGAVEIVARQLGYQPATVQLVVAAGEIRALDLTLTPSITTLDLISITATRDPRSIGDVPAAITVADTTAIRQGRSVGLNETLRMMPGVQTASRFGTDDVNIGIRGSASRARQAIRGIALLLDGVALSEADGVARTDLVELLAAQRIEVVRGPVSALYAGSAGRSAV